jgi:CBS domain-containing protein
MNIGEICTRDVVFTDRGASLQRAAELMRERHVGTLLVTGDSGDGPQVVGIVTDRDVVVDAVARGLDVTRTEIGDLASDDLAAVPMEASIGEAISAMKERRVRRLLVQDDGAVYGVLSLDDLLDALTHEMSELSRAARGGIEREAAERAPFAQTPLVPIRVHIADS